jgi:hypothetical protein
MTWRAAMLAALVATLGRPRWWIIALAGFLVRGGFLLVLPAVVVLPTPAELAPLVVHPSITGIGLGALGPALPALVLALVAASAGVLLATGLAGAWLETNLVGEVAADEELEGLGATVVVVPIVRSLVVRLLAHVPTLAAAAVGVVVMVAAAYAELLAPTGRDSILGRVVLRAPVAVGAVIAVWLVGEAWGGLAVRQLVRGAPLRIALLRGLAGVARPTGLATLVLTSVVVAMPLVGLGLAAGAVFERVWPLVVDRADPVIVTLGIATLAATWGAGLCLLALALAWRSAAWTAEGFRR